MPESIRDAIADEAWQYTGITEDEAWTFADRLIERLLPLIRKRDDALAITDEEASRILSDADTTVARTVADEGISDESRVWAMYLEQLRQRGVRFTRTAAPVDAAELSRRLR